MNNQELELKIKALLENKNLFDLIEQTLDFEKEYKNSDFYKRTKMPLMEIIKYSKVFYAFNIDTLGQRIQATINNLDLSKLNSLLDQIGTTFETENDEIVSSILKFKELKDE